MRVYLVRHAAAAPGDPGELRPLSDSGRESARLLGRRLAEEGLQPDAVLSSPLLRARQTAAELCRSLECGPQTDERLAPGATLDSVRAAVSGRGETVVVVGHQPDCGRVAAAATGGPEPAFPPGGIAVIDL